MSVLDRLLELLDLITGKALSSLLLPLVLVAAGAAVWAAKRPRAGRPIAYVGAVQLCTYLASDLSKPLFGRLRPFEAAERGGIDTWFAGGNSFPSGHEAFYAGLVVPLVMRFPRWWPLLAVPALVALQRVSSHAHYWSDVGASFAVAVLLALLLRPIGRGGVKPPFTR